jgi:SPP1 gp7 family putative phage head morphogenesis protein
MSEKRLVDVENSNLYLFNLLFRHQVYLEGVKAGFNVFFRNMLNDLYGEFAKYVGQSQYDTLDEFSRVKLLQFIQRFKRAQLTAFNRYTQELIGLLQAFVAVDSDVTAAIYVAVNALPDVQPMKEALPSISQLGSDASNAAVWADAANAIVPATGMTIRQMLAAFTLASTSKVINRINMGFANSESLRDVLTSIIGDSEAGYRDGLFATFSNQSDAITATVLQHVSSYTQSAFADSFYTQEQWVSIIDSKTTVICRERNGNIYPTDEGPYPPAHWYCRSKRVPLTNGDALHDIPDTFYEWAADQPEAFLNDALGTVIAAKILAGDSDVKDISVNHSVIPLTLEEFGGKINSITM